MKKIAQITLTATLVLLLGTASAQVPEARQQPGPLRQVAEQFMQAQTAGLPGEVSVVIGSIDPRMNLAACAAPQAFLPSGSRAWGKTTVGLRCLAPTPWTVYVQANVVVTAQYIAAAVPLTQGQAISASQITKLKGDIATLPPGVITDEAQAIGRTVALPLASGAPLRQENLRTPLAVQQGQAVRLVSAGPGFRVSTEARALTAGNDGQLVQVRTTGGQQISGVAKPGGLVEVSY